MSALSRRKGRANQAVLAKRWRDRGLWLGARSTQGEQTRSARLGPKPPDIEGTPFFVEAKHRKALRPMQALLQAETESQQAADWRPCVSVIRPPGVGLATMGECVVIMRLRDFEALARIADWTRYETPSLDDGSDVVGLELDLAAE